MDHPKLSIDEIKAKTGLIHSFIVAMSSGPAEGSALLTFALAKIIASQAKTPADAEAALVAVRTGLNEAVAIQLALKEAYAK